MSMSWHSVILLRRQQMGGNADVDSAGESFARTISERGVWRFITREGFIERKVRNAYWCRVHGQLTAEILIEDELLRQKYYKYA